MQSLLILSPHAETTYKKAQSLCQSYAIDPLDQTILTSEKSIGIEDIRKLQKNISLTPFKSSYKAALVFSADTMTHEAQNAFLKTLEEPPPHTMIFLLAKEEKNFLSTVLSRCSIIRVEELLAERKQHDTANISLFFLSRLSLGEKLHHAEIYGKNKETALQWTEQLLITARANMLVEQTPVFAKGVRLLQQTYTTLSYTNANPRLVIEHMLLTLI